MLSHSDSMAKAWFKGAGRHGEVVHRGCDDERPDPVF